MFRKSTELHQIRKKLSYVSYEESQAVALIPTEPAAGGNFSEIVLSNMSFPIDFTHRNLY